MRDAAEFATRLSGTEIDPSQTHDDVIDPLLEIRWRGDLMLLSETMREEAALVFIRGLADLARSCDNRADALLVVADCAGILGGEC